MIGIIPVKEPVRLPHKHLLELNGLSLLEIVYSRLSSVMSTVIYSKIDIPLPYTKDISDNIVELVLHLSSIYDSFFMVGGDMPLFTVADIKTMIQYFNGITLVPVHADHNIEPLFCIYSGTLHSGKSLKEVIYESRHDEISSNLFSEFAFFNINTPEDYEKAKSIYSTIVK